MNLAGIPFAERAPEVRAAFVEVGYGYVKTSNVVMGVLIVLVIAALHDAVSGFALYGWALAHVINQAARRLLSRLRALATAEHQADARWWFGLVGSTIASAVIHGVFCVLVFDPHDPYVTAVVSLVSIAMTGGGLTFIALSLVQLYSYCILMLVPLAMMSFAAVPERGAPSLWLGLLTVWMAYCCIRYGRSLFQLNLEQIGQKLKVAEQARALAQAQLRAEEANHAKTRFVAAASHDLRQPLQALGIYSTLLEEAADRREAHALAAKMHVLLESLEHSLDSLNDICRLDAGTLTTQLDDVPLQDVIDRAVVAVTHAAQARGLALRVRRTRLWVRTDPALFERIMVNLLSNAIRYTLQGKILVGVRRCGVSAVRVDVFDTGVGIAKHDMKTAFAQYQRLHRGPHGLGLGLTIVDQFARLLGHAVEVRSEPTQGSRFSITLGRVAAQLRAPRLPAPTMFAPAFAGSTVMVIDDEPAVRDSLRAMFERWGCSTSALANAAQALAQVSQGGLRPDLIVADYDLGDGHTGVQAIEAIRGRSEYAIPAILITGQVDRELQCPSPGVVLSKPVAPSALRASVSGLLVP